MKKPYECQLKITLDFQIIHHGLEARTERPSLIKISLKSGQNHWKIPPKDEGVHVLSKLQKTFWTSANSLKMNPQRGYFKRISEAALRKCFVKYVFIKNLQNSHKSTCVRVSYSESYRPIPSVLFKKELWNRCFPVHFVKFVREPFYRTTRSSQQEVSCKKGVLRNFPKFTGKHLYQSLNKVAGLRTEVCNFIKKEATVFLRKISALNGCLSKNWNIEIFFYPTYGVHISL